jgi:hypothetical protein
MPRPDERAKVESLAKSRTPPALARLAGEHRSKKAIEHTYKLIGVHLELRDGTWSEAFRGVTRRVHAPGFDVGHVPTVLVLAINLLGRTCLRRLNLEATITFRIRGRTFEKHKDDFVNAVYRLKPGRIQKHSVLIGNERYPIRQVLAVATKLRVIAVTSQDAYRILKRFGFTVDTEK